MTQQKTITAVDLVDKILEFKSLVPETKEWNLPSLRYNPPRHIRLRQIASLLNAFFEKEPFLELIYKDHYDSILESFLEGKFIVHRYLEDYDEAKQFILDVVEVNKKYILENTKFRLDDIETIFPLLIDYKQRLRALFTFNDRWLEAYGIASNFSILLSNSITQNLDGKLDDLDKAFELIINPKRLRFNQKLLIAKYNYPTENLHDVDMDFF